MRNVFIVLGVMAILVIGWMLWVATPDSGVLAETSKENQNESVAESDDTFIGKVIVLEDVSEDPDGKVSFGFLMSSGDKYILNVDGMKNGLPEDFDGDMDVRITGTLNKSETGTRHGVVGVIEATHIEPADSSFVSTSSDEVTLEGDFICLPHKNTEGVQTDECAFGLRVDEGDMYGMDAENLTEEGWSVLNGPSRPASDTPRLRAVGSVNLPESGNVYDIVGIIKLSSIEELSEEGS